MVIAFAYIFTYQSTRSSRNLLIIGLFLFFSDLTELGRSTRAYSELSGRTEPLLSDVVMAMIEMGADVAGLPEYWKKSNKTAFIPRK